MNKSQYGWIICMASALLLFCTSGLATTGFSAYQPYLITIGGLTNTQASTIIMFRNLFGLLGMLAVTPLMRRFEIRRVVTAAMLICAASFVLYSISNSFKGYCVAASLAGIALGVGGFIPVSVLISRWFNEHRGLALGICMAATGLSVIVASPFITIMVRSYSLKSSFLAEAGFILLATIIVYGALRSRPACLDTEPVGINHFDTAQSYAQHKAPRRLYVGMLIGIFLFGAPANTLYAHISVLYQSVGLDSVQISWLLSIFGVALTVGKCVYGQIADKIGAYRASWILYTFIVIGNGLCCLAENKSFVIAAIGVVLMGFGLAVTTVSISIYAAGIALEEQYSHTVTQFQILSTIGALLFGAVPGIIADTVGNYVPAFIIMLLIVIVSSVLLQFLYDAIRKADVAGEVGILKTKERVKHEL